MENDTIPLYPRICGQDQSRLTLILAEALSDALATPPPKILMLALPLLPKHSGSLNIGGTLIVGAVKQADDAEQDCLGGLYGCPALRGRLVAVFVFFGWVEDGDAELAVFVDIGMERNRVLKGEGGRHVWIIEWEDHLRSKVASYRQTLLLSMTDLLPVKESKLDESTYHRSTCNHH